MFKNGMLRRSFGAVAALSFFLNGTGLSGVIAVYAADNPKPVSEDKNKKDKDDKENGRPARPPGNGPGKPGDDNDGGGNRPPRPQPNPNPQPNPEPRPNPNPNPRPNPEPRPNPNPNPNPNPQPPPAPPPPAPPVDTSAATAAGRSDGERDGRRDGLAKGATEGAIAGERNGYNEGYKRCEAEERREHFDRGYRRGYPEGVERAQREGSIRGDEAGARQGSIDGSSEGRRRANSDAASAASGPGSQRGVEEANASDARDRGASAGVVEGDRQAQIDATKIGYEDGRRQVRQEMESSAVEANDVISQMTQQVSSLQSSMKQTSAMASLMRSSATASRLMSRPWPTPEETAAYQSAYNSSYQSAYNPAYRGAYDNAERGARPAGETRGCREAKQKDYRDEVTRGQREGFDRGYRDNYDRVYNLAYRRSYDDVYPRALDDSYRAEYDSAYQRHFEQARRNAYDAQYQRLYDESFGIAKQQKYNEMFPIYARAEVQRGRADETADFNARPVRLKAAKVSETFVNGLYEPGEILKFELVLRNYLGGTLASSDIQLDVRTSDPRVQVDLGSSTLVKNIRGKSLTTVQNALQFRFMDRAVNSAIQVTVRVTYQGRDVGAQSFTLTPKFLADVRLLETPVLSEGLRTTIKAVVKNQSPQSAENVVVKLRSDASVVELEQTEFNVGQLNPGEETTLEFSVIGRSSEFSTQLPLNFEAVNTTGRRVGLLELAPSVNIRNDYKVKITADRSALKQAGTVRLMYELSNIQSDRLFKGMQMKVQFINTDATNFVVMGPNPQYLTPLETRQSLRFVVPVMVKSANDGGIVELTVYEDGVPVVIHRAQF